VSAERRKAGRVNGDDVAQDVAHDATGGPRANPAALAVPDAAQLLSAAGGQRIAVEMVEADVAAGAPTNGDGTNQSGALCGVAREGDGDHWRLTRAS